MKARLFVAMMLLFVVIGGVTLLQATSFTPAKVTNPNLVGEEEILVVEPNDLFVSSELEAVTEAEALDEYLAEVEAAIEAHNKRIESAVVYVTDGLGHGSGSIVGPNMVLTAKHVAEHPDLYVRLLDGREFDVVDTIMDPNSDAALLIVDANFPSELQLELDATPLNRRDEVQVVGYPGDLPLTVTFGRITTVDYTDPRDGERNLDLGDYVAGPGSSGSPLLRRGRIVGIQVRWVGMPGLFMGSVPTEEFLKDLKLDR